MPFSSRFLRELSCVKDLYMVHFFEIDVGGFSKGNRRIIYLIALAVVVFLIWAANASLDEVVRANGRVVPKKKTQVVQNLEGGIVSEILVAEGDVVEVGQELAKMDDTHFRSSFQELQEQRLALMLRAARLEAERDVDNGFTPSELLISQAPEFASSEKELFEARRLEFKSSIDTLTDTARLRQQEVELLRPMVARKAVAEIELLRIEQAAVEAAGKLRAAQSEFEAGRSKEYAETLIALRQAEQQMRIREDQLDRTDVLSPVHGVVNKVSATTIGGVVRPGDSLVEIIPLDDELRIECRVFPRDIGFVYVGMPASIKLTAFDYSIYGTLRGTVVHVGADTVMDENRRDASPYFEVFVQVTETTLNGPNGTVEIRPGMQAEVELETGKKTVLEYLLKPLFKTTEAFKER